MTAFCLKPLFMSDLRDVLVKSLQKVREEKYEEGQFDFSGRRILLAEDNIMNQLISEEILSVSGFEIEIADNGQIAVGKVKSAPAGYYDIILMDIQMPVMDGYEATRQIRSLEDREKASIPIIAVTANVFEENKKNALDVGMNGHLAKTYDIPKIISTLKEILN